MKPSRIVYRTRGGPTQGWGNVFRLASFAERCRDRGHADATFLAEGPPEAVSKDPAVIDAYLGAHHEDKSAYDEGPVAIDHDKARRVAEGTA